MKRPVIIILALLLSIPSFAQEARKDEKTSQKEQIMAAKVAYFTTEIGLTPEEAQTFWPVYNKCWDDSQKAHKATKQSLKSIKELDEKGKYSEVEMKKLINNYLDCYLEEGRIQEMYKDEFFKILSTEKVAKLYIAEDGFRRKLTKMWKEQSQDLPKPDGQMVPPPVKR